MTQLNSEELKEVDRLYGIISERSRTSNSIIIAMEISQMRREGELECLRFFERFWESETSSVTINAVYQAAQSLGKQTADVSDIAMYSLKRIGAALEDRFPHIQYKEKIDALHELSRLTLTNPGREEFIASLVVERNLNVPEVVTILRDAESTPTPLTGGSL